MTISTSGATAAHSFIAQSISLAQSGEVLLSPWKPVLLLAPLVAWAILVSKVFDKHAVRFHLPNKRWNLIHLSAGVGAVAAAVAIGAFVPGEGSFWMGLGVMVVILAADAFAFMSAANKDERIPGEHHLKFNLGMFLPSIERKEKEDGGKVALRITAPDGMRVKAPEEQTPEYAVRVSAERLYIDAIAKRASQIDVTPTGKDKPFAATMLIDGVRAPLQSLQPVDAIRVIDFWKRCAGLDLEDRRKRQADEISVEQFGVTHSVKVTTSGVSGGGVRLMLLFDPEEAVSRPFEEIGLSDKQVELIREMNAEATGGVFLVTAPADNGRTTTFYALLSQHDAYTANMQTIELEPEATLEGVKQIRFDPAGEMGGEFSTTLRSIFRRDPDVVGVAEVPDEATAQEITKAELDRARVYVCMPAMSAAAAIQAWVKVIGEPKKAAGTLVAALNQRLIRRLCKNCKVAYQPPEEMLRKLGLKPGSVKQFHKKSGQVLVKDKPEVCPMCEGLGYHGQIGVFEVFRVGEPERELIVAKNFQGLLAQFRKSGQPSLQASAIRLAVEGVTSVDEVIRVTAQKKSPASTAAPAATAAAG